MIRAALLAALVLFVAAKPRPVIRDYSTWLAYTECRNAGHSEAYCMRKVNP